MSAKVTLSGTGFMIDISVEGTLDEVSAAIDDIKGRYPPPGYGTWFNWSPDGTPIVMWGKPSPHKRPVALGDGRYRAYGHRQSSCD